MNIDGSWNALLSLSFHLIPQNVSLRLYGGYWATYWYGCLGLRRYIVDVWDLHWQICIFIEYLLGIRLALDNGDSSFSMDFR